MEKYAKKAKVTLPSKRGSLLGQMETPNGLRYPNLCDSLSCHGFVR